MSEYVLFIIRVIYYRAYWQIGLCVYVLCGLHKSADKTTGECVIC